jgi:tyrosine-protein phosphatase SIW14
VFCGSFCLHAQQLNDNKLLPRKLNMGGMKNLHELNEELYRSDQPSRRDFRKLEEAGIKTIISLRNYHQDKKKMKKSKMKLIHVPMQAKLISFQNVVDAMKAYRDCEKPVLVHCLQGSDRTGCMIAMIRMIFHEWNKEEAIREFMEDKYDYNQKLFPNILPFLQDIELEKVRTAMKEA